jgi:signal recognition particle subunit SEC65
MDAAGGEARVSSSKTWSVVYPVYIDSKKTVAEGRRVAAGEACPDPTCAEIADCWSHLKIPCAIEVTHQNQISHVRVIPICRWITTDLVLPCYFVCVGAVR